MLFKLLGHNDGILSGMLIVILRRPTPLKPWLPYRAMAG